ncbi:MAG: phosphoribosylformylglycinamidine synthase subunit PurQ [Thermodesulfobacteriota bacterium]
MKVIKALVMTGYGLNCDHETAHAFEMAGARAFRVHINSLIDRSVSLKDFQIMAMVGGFSWGDDHGAGVIQAVRLRTHVGKDILEFIDNGGLIIGICNGFQALVNMGLLPGLDRDYTRRSVALLSNECGNFRNDWITLEANSASPCVFTTGIERIELPVRHGEGKFHTDQTTLNRLISNNQVALRYALPEGGPAEGSFPHNPNGSLFDIAGICDPTGRIFGLMPHPEAYNHVINHPNWTLQKETSHRTNILKQNQNLGIRVFQNAVQQLK